MDSLTAQHQELAAGRWSEMPFSLQMANIGSEVSRALRWQRKGRTEKAVNALFRALELIDLSLADQCAKQNRGHLRELCRCREELCDYFLGDNDFHTDPVRLQRYYDQFAMLGR